MLLGSLNNKFEEENIMDENCLFCKIIKGEIPSDKLYEDDDVLAFWDITPQTPTHFLVVPKKHIARPCDTEKADDQLMGKMLRIGAQVAREQGIGDHYRVVINNGKDAGQIIFHTHIHILGGQTMSNLI